VEFDGSPPSPADTALVATCAQASGIYRRAARSAPQRGTAPITIRVGINGFGRIGRQVYRAIRQHYSDRIDVVAVNDVGNRNIMTHLLKYDTNYGRFRGEVRMPRGSALSRQEVLDEESTEGFHPAGVRYVHKER
jgi:hypothetical protein